MSSCKGLVWTNISTLGIVDCNFNMCEEMINEKSEHLVVNI